MRARAVKVIAWGLRNGPRIRRAATRVAMFVGGLAILHREIWEVQTAEPLLVFLGLWLIGIAPAQFFDGLKKLGQEAKGQIEQSTDATPAAKDKLQFKNGEA